MTAFTYRAARSGALVAGFALVIGVETLVLHLWLMTRHPVFAWVLTSASVATIAWLVADYRALGRGAVHIAGSTLELRIGRRISASVPLATIAAVTRPTWRDVPAPGTPAAEGYVNLMRPASPN